MATLWELKQAKQAEEARQGKLIGAAAGTVAQFAVKTVIESGAAGPSAGPAGIVASVIDIVGALGIAAWSYLTQKKQIEKREKRLRKEGKTQEAVTDVLQEIEDTGLAIIEQHGIDPTTSDFEKILYDTLFQKIGYRGNCNATVWAPTPPESKKKTIKKISAKPEPRRVMFYITGGGRKFTPGKGFSFPRNLQTYWYIQCKNAKDKWINAYTELLIQQGRIRELENFQASLKKGQTVVRVIFIIIFLVLGVFAVINSIKIKV